MRQQLQSIAQSLGLAACTLVRSQIYGTPDQVSRGCEHNIKRAYAAIEWPARVTSLFHPPLPASFTSHNLGAMARPGSAGDGLHKRLFLFYAVMTRNVNRRCCQVVRHRVGGGRLKALSRAVIRPGECRLTGAQ
ncbi:hypothetical protein BaRGS_00015479 [Batillaria attramentaria]|uniref:Uncharacterized protein n=1 Tax=Batillaria attramentaria TaxID=370345 RepID=A0ABD0L2B8_9CAEN